MAQILDGLKISNEIKQEIKTEVDKIKASGKIFPAKTFPNSTPNWSKLNTFQITPCTKILCS